jgi:hypothetical protein
MNQALPLAILYGFVLAGLAASLLAVFCARRLVRGAERRDRSVTERNEAALDAMRRDVAALAERLEEARSRVEAAAPVALRPGFNLSKRSQALRMHRRGDAPERISAALGVPRQEVDLLLKVHRMLVEGL